jgi:hypothetical protein
VEKKSVTVKEGKTKRRRVKIKRNTLLFSQRRAPRRGAKK